jgi:hypothetical protein
MLKIDLWEVPASGGINNFMARQKQKVFSFLSTTAGEFWPLWPQKCSMPCPSLLVAIRFLLFVPHSHHKFINGQRNNKKIGKRKKESLGQYKYKICSEIRMGMLLTINPSMFLFNSI